MTNPSGLAVNATHLFWTSSLSSTTGNIGRAGLDGSNVNLAHIDGSTAGRGLSGPAGIAVNNTHIFWANLSGIGSGNPQNIRWATIGGNHLGVLATGTHFPRSVAIDGTYAYWSNALSAGTTYGRVKITDTSDVDQAFIDGRERERPIRHRRRLEPRHHHRARVRAHRSAGHQGDAVHGHRHGRRGRDEDRPGRDGEPLQLG